MEKLFTPDVGLMVWTALTFLCLVFVLARFAWNPILKAIDLREEGIQANIHNAEKARVSAEQLRQDYETRLADVGTQVKALLAGADAQARQLKEDMIQAATAETARLMKASRLKLLEEEQRLIRSLRTEMAEISLTATEKMLRRGMDKPFQERLTQEALQSFDAWAGSKKC